MMRRIITGVLCVVLCISALSCGKKAQPLPPEPMLSVFWEHATLNMDPGESRELKWISNRPIQPRIYSEGSAVIITGMTQDSVQIRAFEGGIDIISLHIEDQEVLCIVTVNEDMFHFIFDDYDETALPEIKDAVPVTIIVPYTKEYLSPGQETKLTARLENGAYGDEMDFSFTKEPGKHSIAMDSVYNVATIKAIAEGEQYIRISHPRAAQSRIIVYDVLPPAPPPPPSIDVSESPLIVGKGETKPLHILLLNGTTADRNTFQFKVIENAYAITVKQHGNILNVTGIAPGAGKIRITHPAVTRDYDVMVLVD
ncbi:MAG: hypothetical protein FWD36_10475 [Treponema sp.]|nr:hypothetical protein [Treponema sp.]